MAFVTGETRRVTEGAGPSIERFRDGWVLVDRVGTISTPTPMTEGNARAYAARLGIDFPDGDAVPVASSGPPGLRDRLRRECR
jgi:hypothetical protein